MEALGTAKAEAFEKRKHATQGARLLRVLIARQIQLKVVWSTPIEYYWWAFNGTQLGGSSSASRPLYPSHAVIWVSSYVLMDH